MKLIHSSAEVWRQGYGLEGAYKAIERAARLSYKSEDKITADSAKHFVERLIKSEHLAPLEFGTVYLTVPTYLVSKFTGNHYSRISGPTERNFNWYVTTNLRVLIENDLLERCMPYITEQSCNHYSRITLHVICSRGISHELVRHRALSFMQESQRFINYSKGKFGKEITYILPSWYKEENLDSNNIVDKTSNQAEIDWQKSLRTSESVYFSLLDQQLLPQYARDVLPNATKTELAICGFASDWKHFFDLRYFGTTGSPHPDMLNLSTKMKAALEQKNLWTLISK